MRAFDYMPGIPAAGHVANGFWHPGAARNCHKTPCYEPPTFTCPQCGARSANPNDVREKYCGRCHKQTG